MEKAVKRRLVIKQWLFLSLLSLLCPSLGVSHYSDLKGVYLYFYLLKDVNYHGECLVGREEKHQAEVV